MNLLGPTLALGSALASVTISGSVHLCAARVDGPAPTCRVYFDRAYPTRSLSGVLHGVGDNQPPDERISGISPALWRGHPAFRNRLEKLGARFVILMPEGYGYPPGYNGHGPPFSNWPAYEDTVNKFIDAYPDRGAIWEPWNEPDFPQFWTGTLEQYHELYARAFRIIRAKLGPTVSVAGPSFAFETPERIRAFLDACLANDVEVNVLTLHLLQLDNDIPRVESRLKEIRQLFVRNPRYSRLKIKQVHVNEIIGESAFLRPGDNLAYLDFAERGGADGACRACWRDSSGAESCFNNTLAGLVTPGTFLPRSVWWAYHAYSGGVSTRVYSQVLSKELAVLASTHGMSGESPQIVVARYGNGAAPVTPDLEIHGLGTLVDKVHDHWKITIYRLPNSGEAALESPPILDVKRVALPGESLSVRIPPVAPHEALIVQFEPD